MTHREWEAGARASCFLPVLDSAGPLRCGWHSSAGRADGSAEGREERFWVQDNQTSSSSRPMAGLWEEAFQGCVWVFPCSPVSPSAAGWLAVTSTCRWIAFGPLLCFNYLPTFKMRKSHIQTETRLLACFKAWGDLAALHLCPVGLERGMFAYCPLPLRNARAANKYLKIKREAMRQDTPVT